MGANAQTTVPTFTASQVLTAEQQNQSARTGVPVFATTVTRDAAFGGSGKTLAEGQLAYIEATDVVQYYDGTSWATLGPASAGGLVLISATTIGSAVASTTVSNVFSSTYDNYKITVSGGAFASGGSVSMQLGSTNTGYYRMVIVVNASNGNSSTNNQNNASSWANVGIGTTNQIQANFDLFSPNLAKDTIFYGWEVNNSIPPNGGVSSGVENSNTQHTGFTLNYSQNATGGTIRVYGYANS